MIEYGYNPLIAAISTVYKWPVVLYGVSLGWGVLQAPYFYIYINTCLLISKPHPQNKAFQ
jgi:hypothetical protein